MEDFVAFPKSLQVLLCFFFSFFFMILVFTIYFFLTCLFIFTYLHIQYGSFFFTMKEEHNRCSTSLYPTINTTVNPSVVLYFPLNPPEKSLTYFMIPINIFDPFNSLSLSIRMAHSLAKHYSIPPCQ